MFEHLSLWQKLQIFTILGNSIAQNGVWMLKQFFMVVRTLRMGTRTVTIHSTIFQFDFDHLTTRFSLCTLEVKLYLLNYSFKWRKNQLSQIPRQLEFSITSLFVLNLLWSFFTFCFPLLAPIAYKTHTKHNQINI